MYVKISKVSNGELKTLEAFEFKTKDAVEKHFSRLRNIFATLKDQKLDYLIDLHIGYDLVDTISIDKESADWLLNDFYGLAKTKRRKV